MRHLFFYLVLAVLFLLFYVRNGRLIQLPVITQHVTGSNTSFQLEVARTDQEQRRGLMGRTDLCPTCGMLFVFSKPGIYPFWMRNTFIPLDIIWLDRNGAVVYSVMATPLQGIYTNPTPAQYVIELPAGSVSKYGLADTIFELNGIID